MLVFFPHLIWLEQTGALDACLPGSPASPTTCATWAAAARRCWSSATSGLPSWSLLGRGFTLSPRGPAAEVERAPVDPDARTFVYFFALAPAVAIGLLALFTGRAENFVAPPLVVLSALAVIVAAPRPHPHRAPASDRNMPGRRCCCCRR